MTLTIDSNGLYIDPDGDYTLDPSYSATDPDLVAFYNSDADYCVDIDDDTEDVAQPQSHLRKNFRKRIRKIRKSVKNVDPSEWIRLRDIYRGGDANTATQGMLAHWLAVQLGFPQ